MDSKQPLRPHALHQWPSHPPTAGAQSPAGRHSPRSQGWAGPCLPQPATHTVLGQHLMCTETREALRENGEEKQGRESFPRWILPRESTEEIRQIVLKKKTGKTRNTKQKETAGIEG